MTVGWLYMHFARGLEFWTLWEIALKVYLMGFLYSVHEDARPYFGAVVSGFALTVVTYCRPHRNPIVFTLAVVKWFATTVLYLSATQLGGSPDFDGWGEVIMVGLMIIVDTCFLFGVVMIFYRLWQALQADTGGKATFRLKSAVGKISFTRKLAMLKPPKDLHHSINDDLHLFMATGEGTTSDMGGKSKVSVYPIGTDAKEVERNESSKEDIRERTLSTTSVEDAGSVEDTGNGNQISPVPAAEPYRHVPVDTAPRFIGGGWWETYDPNSGRMFYSHVDGKPTTWDWPEEVARDSHHDNVSGHQLEVTRNSRRTSSGGGRKIKDKSKTIEL
jgi:hypothetical protein